MQKRQMKGLLENEVTRRRNIPDFIMSSANDSYILKTKNNTLTPPLTGTKESIPHTTPVSNSEVGFIGVKS